jgi:hypothetical protein
METRGRIRLTKEDKRGCHHVSEEKEKKRAESNVEEEKEKSGRSQNGYTRGVLPS